MTGASVPGAAIEITTGPNRGKVALADAADGSFSFATLAAGTARLRATAPGFLASESTDFTLTGDQFMTLGLRPAPASSIFAGVVQDGVGSPVPGVRVTATLPSGDRQTVVSDAAGTWEIRAAAPAVALTWEPRVGHEGERTGVTAAPAGRIVLTARRILRVVPEIAGSLTFTGPVAAGARLPVVARVFYDTGESSPGRLDVATITSSEPSVLNWVYQAPGDARPGVSDLEARAPGTAVIYASYWGVWSEPVAVRVAP